MSSPALTDEGLNLTLEQLQMNKALKKLRHNNLAYKKGMAIKNE